MTTAAKLVAAKIPAEQAKALVGDADKTVTATGTTAADAYAIRQAFSKITAGAATTGVKLPTANAPDTFIITNYSGSDKKLYPPSGGKLNNGTADANAVLLDGATAICVCVGTVDYAILSNGLGA